MTFATLLTAAIGYALIYAAMPNRTALRDRPRAITRRLIAAGVAILVSSAAIGAVGFGWTVGPTVTLTVAMTVGTVLILVGPLRER